MEAPTTLVQMVPCRRTLSWALETAVNSAPRQKFGRALCPPLCPCLLPSICHQKRCFFRVSPCFFMFRQLGKEKPWNHWTCNGFRAWWGMVDSNHRRRSQQIYSLSPLATREIPHMKFVEDGAGRRTRTPDLLITNQLLYQLSYTSISTEQGSLYSTELQMSRTCFVFYHMRTSTSPPKAAER